MRTVYRIGHRELIADLEGMGAALYGGRWNRVGLPCLYTSMHLSLALLEHWATAQGSRALASLATLRLRMPAEIPMYHIDESRLPHHWHIDVAYTQWLGSQILEDPGYAGFVAPSAVVPGEYNVILNPGSPHFHLIEWEAATPLEVDARLLPAGAASPA